MTNRISYFLILSITAAGFSSSVWAKSHFLPEADGGCWNNFNSVCSKESDSPGRTPPSDYLSCKEAGYTVSSCPAGYLLKESERCPFGIGTKLYKACYSIAELCQKMGYALSCTTGYEPDLKQYCPYDSLYIKCKCAQCIGYDYTEQEANAPGFVPDGEPCLSCMEKRYKRKINPCSGYDYDSSNCGVNSCGRLSGDTCQSGSIIKYKECRACPVPSCGAGYWNLDSYWCNSALRCWLPKAH